MAIHQIHLTTAFNRNPLTTKKTAHISQAILLLILALPGTAIAQTINKPPLWKPANYGTPVAGGEFAMTFDTARGCAVLFGGDNLDRTWELSGPNWKAYKSPAYGEYPSNLYSPAMAYDSKRRVSVLFGGYPRSPYKYSGPSDDTWEWDGIAWQWRLTPNRPSARSGAAMAFDTDRNRTVLFGGGANDTWEWDGMNWTSIPTTGPPLRRDHAMAYDSLRHRMVLFGGFLNFNSNYGDTWEYNGTSWTQVATTGPSPRYGHAMTFDPIRGRTVLFGGLGSSLFSDTWEWDGATWTQRTAPGPTRRFYGAMVFDTTRARSILFGGWSASYLTDATDYTLNDTWEWDGAVWSQRLSVPKPRQNQCMAYDSGRGRLVMFGGAVDSSLDGEFSNVVGDTWEWDGQSWIFKVTQSAPGPRAGAAMAYDPSRHRTTLFGGSQYSGDSGTAYNDTWEWDGQQWILSTTGPLRREGHAMVHSPVNNQIILFGGSYNYVSQNDTWGWNGSAWTLLSFTGPRRAPSRQWPMTTAVTNSCYLADILIP